MMVNNWRVYLRHRNAFEKAYDETVSKAIDRMSLAGLWDQAMLLPYGIDVWQEAQFGKKQ